MATPELSEKPVLLRIPEYYLIVIDGLVKQSKGKFKSRNDLVIEILSHFCKQLEARSALRKKKKRKSKKNG